MKGAPEEPAFDEWMGQALSLATRAAVLDEVPIGAVLLDGGVVVGSGFNQPVSSRDPTAHAEIVALRGASRLKSNYRLPGTTMVVTVEPCLMCAGALINARVSRLIYGVREPKSGAIESLLRLNDLGLNHQVEIIGGVRAVECADLLQTFFRSRRETGR